MENIYLKTKDKKECNGCTACALICPVNAIKMKEDTMGFIYPVIDDTLCIKCGKCLRTCSNHKVEDKEYTAYAAINKNETVLKKSTSGGTFYALAKKIFSRPNSVCFGAVLDKDFNVKHTRATNLEEALKFMGSKYVRSNIDGIYKMIKHDLDKNMHVLFTGTPCQTMGLYTYLNKPYPKLITCNIICHSNPSPKVFKKYIKCLELNHNSKITSFKFRDKENGWKSAMPTVKFENGEKLCDDSYTKAFFRGLISRECCTNCKFIKPYNYADITIGDFWGVEKLTDIKNYENGISLVLANSKEGKEFITGLQDVEITQLDNQIDVFRYNHNVPIKEHRNKEKFVKRLDKCKDEDIIQLLKNMSKERLVRRILKKLKLK